MNRSITYSLLLAGLAILAALTPEGATAALGLLGFAAASSNEGGGAAATSEQEGASGADEGGEAEGGGEGRNVEWADELPDEWGGDTRFDQMRRSRLDVEDDPGADLNVDAEGAEGGQEGAEGKASDDKGAGEGGDSDPESAGQEQDEEESGEGQEADEALQAVLGEENAQMFVERFLRSVGEQAPVRTVDDAIQYAADLTQVANAYNDLEELAASTEGFPEFIQHLADGKPPHQAATEAFEGLQAVAPDPEEDPEAWMEHEVEKRLQRKMEEAGLTEEQQRKGRRTDQREQAARLFDRFTDERDMSQEEAEAFLSTYRSVVMGDKATGRLRPDMFDVIYKGLHHDDLVQEAVEEARIEAKNAGIEEAVSTHSGKRDRPAPIKAGGGDAPDKNDTKRRRSVQRKRRFARDGNFTETLLGDWQP